MKRRILAAILAAAMTFTAAPTLLPAADISVSAAKSEKLPAPSRIDVVERTDDSATLLWSSVEGADGYVIYRYNSKTKKYEKLKNLTREDYPVKHYSTKYPSYKIEGMKKGETYRFKIAARVKGKDGKYTVQTKSKAVKVKNVDTPEFSLPTIGMTESEFLKTNESNAFALNFMPLAFMDPYGGYKGKVLYQGKPAEVSINFNNEGRIIYFTLLRRDTKKSDFQRERDRLTKMYGEPFSSVESVSEYTGADYTEAQWFLQEDDKDRGTSVDYVYMSTDQQLADMIYMFYIYERADEFGKIIKERKDQYPTAPYGVKGEEEA